MLTPARRAIGVFLGLVALACVGSFVCVRERARVDAEIAATRADLSAQVTLGRSAREAGAPSSTELAKQRLMKLDAGDRERFVTSRAMKGYAAQLDGEGSDPAWSATQAQAVSTFIGEVSPWKVAEATCAKTLCRIRVSYADDSEREAYMHRIIGQGPLATNVFFAPDPQGTGTVIYASRSGFKLPTLDMSL